MAAEHTTASLPPLTAKAIEAAEPRVTDYELPDSAAPGLRLRVTPKGGKVFRWYVTSLGRVITIGRWAKVPRPGHVSLGEARTWLERLKEAHRAGPAELAKVEAELQALRPARAAAAARPPEGTLLVEDLVKKWRLRIDQTRKNPDEVYRTLEHDILPALGKRPILDVTTREVRELVESVVARGAPTQAGRVLSHVKQLFGFARSHVDELRANPAEPLNPGDLGVANRVCNRYLTADEIPAFWKAIDRCTATPSVRAALKLLLLLGVRSGELLEATWDEVDFEAATWTLPVSHQKLTKEQEQKARPWVVPLAPQAMELFRELEAFAKSIRSKHVASSFSARGGPLSEKALNHAMRRLFESKNGKEPLLKFDGERPTPHDLRRTVRRHLEETLNVPFHTAERCLNHSLGRIAETYGSGDYVVQRREALELWGAYVERLVTGEGAEVVRLPTARSAR